MAQVLHIKDAYFELPDKHNDDIGCMVTLLGLHLQQNKDVSEDDTCNIEYELIEKYKTEKQVVIFKSRKEADDYLNKI